MVAEREAGQAMVEAALLAAIMLTAVMLLQRSIMAVMASDQAVRDWLHQFPL